MNLLKTCSRVHMQALRVFEPLMVITGIVTPLATVPPKNVEDPAIIEDRGLPFALKSHAQPMSVPAPGC
jgi:hypothetical protein